MVGFHAEGLVMRRLQHCGGGCVLKKEVATATSVVVVRVLSSFLPNWFWFCIGLQAARPRSPSSADLISISSKLAQSKIWSSASYWPEQLRRCLASTGTSSWSTSFSNSTFLCTWKKRVDAQWRGKSKDPHPRNLAQMPAAPIVQLLRPSCASHLVTQILVGCVSDPYCITETSRPGLRAPLPFRPSCLKVCLISRYPR